MTRGYLMLQLEHAKHEFNSIYCKQLYDGNALYQRANINKGSWAIKSCYLLIIDIRTEFNSRETNNHSFKSYNNSLLKFNPRFLFNL